MEGSRENSRARLVIALGAALVLGGIVAAVVALGGGDGDPPATVAAAPACVRSWNEDVAATAYGRHNFNFHEYDGALVTFLTDDGRQVEEGEGGKCAVIFPSRVLDTEPFAAGELLRGGRWLPLSELPGIELARVAELQAEAARAPNTSLDPTGRLGPG